MSILVIDTAASPSPSMVLTGDTLFKDVEMNRAGHPVEKEGADECAEASPSSSRP